MGRFPAIKPENKLDNEPRLVKIRLSDGSEPLSISRNHALFSLKNGHWFVEDQGSSNGIYINGDSIPISKPVQLSKGTLVKLSRSNKPSIEYSFEPETSVSGIGLDSGLLEKLLNTLRCIKCDQLFRQAACLPCGHVFCVTCVSSSTCPVCETERLSTGRGFASRCHPLDELVAMLKQEKSLDQTPNTNANPPNAVFFELREAGDEEDHYSELAKRQRLEESSKMQGRCEYCAEPMHEEGEECPSRVVPSENEEEEMSDLDDYV